LCCWIFPGRNAASTKQRAARELHGSSETARLSKMLCGAHQPKVSD